jgi:peptidoglycan/xylan/chitin deacetylase (PgdA/CDA1 family)
MRYVILRDDDTNALTPVGCLERLYRPLLDRGLPVNLATIPCVSTEAVMADGRPEGFLLGLERKPDPVSATAEAAASRGTKGSAAFADYLSGSFPKTIHIGAAEKLVCYLLQNPGYHIAQHGLHHDYLEFDRHDRGEIARRLDEGTRLLMDAGFERPGTFVAPYDRISRPGLAEVARRFRVFSTGWYELRRLPRAWWPWYALKKARRSPHWRIGRTLLLSHPGCLLSCQRSYSSMLGSITHYVNRQHLTVLVTHWWEYFRDGKPDELFIESLHETAEYLATQPGLKVISFEDLASGRGALE